MTFVVGLTGGIGCGKSSTSQFFSDLGIDVIDTDVIARQLTQPNGSAISLIQNTFGSSVITADGALDRNKMRDLVFANSESRHKLEQILHPLILKAVIRRIKQSQAPYVIVVIPLLFETNDYNHLIQHILVIDCDEQQQLLRTMERSNLSEQKVRSIMATQVTRETRIQKADDVILNNQDIEYLKAQILLLHHKYLALSKNEPAI
ncbi:MAG TPA: dephospho-CoA kinase [Nitrosomonas sp.]|jgi:dephospho-CoA kinase|nr:dephospho-CoA kinase [Nitrosomonas sp.]MBP9870488.1 dephospho-CoA kinase [Nitrosomonas sp.]MDO8334559.1 dephospho-CoA kinase [Nitrosomonas sp.]HQV89594.1 dephospho-CoA kinase [Nitrosomonas sp.]HRB97928.1 dephospho-CoA kinase [Nitrosomonas sp.]